MFLEEESADSPYHKPAEMHTIGGRDGVSRFVCLQPCDPDYYASDSAIYASTPGLFDSLTDREVIDLVAYLRTAVKNP